MKNIKIPLVIKIYWFIIFIITVFSLITLIFTYLLYSFSKPFLICLWILFWFFILFIFLYNYIKKVNVKKWKINIILSSILLIPLLFYLYLVLDKEGFFSFWTFLFLLPILFLSFVNFKIFKINKILKNSNSNLEEESKILYTEKVQTNWLLPIFSVLTLLIIWLLYFIYYNTWRIPDFKIDKKIFETRHFYKDFNSKENQFFEYKKLVKKLKKDEELIKYFDRKAKCFSISNYRNELSISSLKSCKEFTDLYWKKYFELEKKLDGLESRLSSRNKKFENLKSKYNKEKNNDNFKKALNKFKEDFKIEKLSKEKIELEKKFKEEEKKYLKNRKEFLENLYEKDKDKIIKINKIISYYLASMKNISEKWFFKSFSNDESLGDEKDLLYHLNTINLNRVKQYLILLKLENNDKNYSLDSIIDSIKYDTNLYNKWDLEYNNSVIFIKKLNINYAFFDYIINNFEIKNSELKKIIKTLWNKKNLIKKGGLENGIKNNYLLYNNYFWNIFTKKEALKECRKVYHHSLISENHCLNIFFWINQEDILNLNKKVFSDIILKKNKKYTPPLNFRNYFWNEIILANRWNYDSSSYKKEDNLIKYQQEVLEKVFKLIQNEE